MSRKPPGCSSRTNLSRFSKPCSRSTTASVKRWCGSTHTLWTPREQSTLARPACKLLTSSRPRRPPGRHFFARAMCPHRTRRVSFSIRMRPRRTANAAARAARRVSHSRSRFSSRSARSRHAYPCHGPRRAPEPRDQHPAPPAR